VTDLLVTPHTPALGTGRSLRTYAIARVLASHGGVEVLYVEHGAVEPAPELRALEGVSLVAVRPSRGLRRALTYARARAAGVPRGFARGISPELQAAAGRLARAPGRGRVIADGPVAAAALLPLARRRPVVYNAHNVESSLRASIPGELRDFGTPARLARFERRLFDTASETWMVSDADMQEARQIAPNAAFRYVPNVVDVTSIRPVPRTGSRRVLYAGDFSYAPNRLALAFLADEVMPIVWASVPEATLVVTGRSLELPAGSDPRVDARGFVDDLEAVYRSVDCVAVPLLQSGGSPLKFVEALAHGLPVVATSRAARGLAAEAGAHYLAGDDAGAFAAAVVRALRGEAQDVAAAGRALAAREYSLEKLAELVAG